MTLEDKLEEMKVSRKWQSEQGSGTASKDSDVCPKCGGSGWIPYEQDGMLFAKECDCRESDLMSRRLSFANIPDTFKDKELKTLKTSVYATTDGKQKFLTACNIVKRYIDNFDDMLEAGMGLYIVSRTKGSGKTRMAASIANELVKKHKKQVKFAVSTRILDEIRSTWKKDSEYAESRLIDQLCLADVLIIDDFGVERISPWVQEKFYNIINERYIHKKITIYTSNVPIEELNYEDRITSRIKEVSYLMEFPEESVRDLIAKQHNKEMLEKLAEEAKGRSAGKSILT